MELWRFLGEGHVTLGQVPLVLLFVGLFFPALGLLGRGEWRGRARWAGLVTSGMGTVGLLFAFICGIYAEIWAGRAGVPQHPIELHERAANGASWGFVILFAWRLLLAETRGTMGREELSPQRHGDTEGAQSGTGKGEFAQQTDGNGRRKWLAVYVVVGFFWYGLLVVTGYLGGEAGV